MAVIALFDKSFLQSLSVDESVWFDRFFLSVICPVFYVETLADLAKTPKNRSAEDEVGIIASKFPEVHGNPCVNHLELCIHNMLGYDVPMDSRIPRPGGRPVKGGGKTGYVFDQSLEEIAFQRWQERRFYEAEKASAALWRQTLAIMDLNVIGETMRKTGADKLEYKTLAAAKGLAENVVNQTAKPYEILGLAVQFFKIPQHTHETIAQRWHNSGRPAFNVFAPYAAHVLTVEIFFWLAISKGLISADRNSNKVDIAYLYYLPFCQVFISNDKLHAKTAPLFLRSDQEFVPGLDLKADLKKLNEHYLGAIPEEDRKKGLFKLAPHPPLELGSLVTELWSRHLAPHALSPKEDAPPDPERDRKLVAQLNAFTEGENIPIENMPKDDDVMAISIQRKISMKKGAWWQIPHDVSAAKDD